MRPPICELCGGRAVETVRFADYAPLPPDGPVGHPKGLGWFCERHLGAARSLTAHSLGAATEALRRRRWLPVFSLLIAVSAGLAIRGHYPGADRWLVYLFKPLTTALIIGLAARPRSLTYPRYRTPVLIGLVFALFGDVFLMLPVDWFLAGLASFAVTQICYLAAFRSDIGWAPRWLPFAALGSVAAALLAVLWPGLSPTLRAPVVLYAGLLAAMTAQATGRASAFDRRSAWVAAAGALLFMCSDSILAVDRFRFPFEASRAVVLSTYFTGQWLIALSVELYHSESPGPQVCPTCRAPSPAPEPPQRPDRS